MILQRLSSLSTSSYRCSRVYNRSILSCISSYDGSTLAASTVKKISSSVSTVTYSNYQALQQRSIFHSSIGSGYDSTTLHQYSSTTTVYQKTDDDNNTELNEFGHDYTQIGGPIDTYLCTLSETEIHERIRTRMQHKLKREYKEADKIQEELKDCGVILDRNRMWRADGSNSFPQTQLGRSRSVKSNNNIKGGGTSSVGQIRKFSTSSGLYNVHGRGSRHDGKRGGRDYTKVGGLDKSICTLTETEINNMIRTRMQCRLKRDYQQANKIQEELRQCGVAISDEAKLWRADGEKFVANIKSTNKMPRMKDCSTLDDAIKAMYDNLDKVSPRDISAFWAVVPRLLRYQERGVHLVPQLQAIFYKTADQIHSYGPQNLTTTTLGFAKIIQALQISKGGYVSGSYEEYLNSILIRQRDAVFSFLARTAVPILHQFEPRHLKDLAYSYALLDFVPTLDDGSLFDHIAEKSIPLLDKFKPQELSNIVWGFEKVKLSHPDLFNKVADHIVSLDNLNGYNEQDISNLTWAYRKAGIIRQDLNDKLIGVAMDRKFSVKRLETLNRWASEEGIQNIEVAAQDEDENGGMVAVEDDNDENNNIEEYDGEIEDDDDTASVSEDLSLLTVVQLKDRLRNLGLPVSGRKHELISRLNDHFQS